MIVHIASSGGGVHTNNMSELSVHYAASRSEEKRKVPRHAERSRRGSPCDWRWRDWGSDTRGLTGVTEAEALAGTAPQHPHAPDILGPGLFKPVTAWHQDTVVQEPPTPFPPPMNQPEIQSFKNTKPVMFANTHPQNASNANWKHLDLSKLSRLSLVMVQHFINAIFNFKYSEWMWLFPHKQYQSFHFI